MNKNTKSPSERNLGFFQKNDTVTTIYIGNMSFKKDERDIKELFNKFGKVSYVRLMLDPETNKSRGFAFVQMPSPKNAKLAIGKLNGAKVDGRTLKVSVAKENSKSQSAVVARRPKKETLENESEAAPKKTKRKRDKGLKLLFNYLNQ